MHLYSLMHCPGNDVPIALKEGFSWNALFFGPLWFAWHRMWLEAAASGVLWALFLALPPLPSSLAQVALFWLIGLEGNSLRRWALERKGCHEKAVVPAHDEEEALLHALPSEG